MERKSWQKWCRNLKKSCSSLLFFFPSFFLYMFCMIFQNLAWMFAGKCRAGLSSHFALNSPAFACFFLSFLVWNTHGSKLPKFAAEICRFQLSFAAQSKEKNGPSTYTCMKSKGKITFCPPQAAIIHSIGSLFLLHLNPSSCPLFCIGPEN